MAQGSFPCAKTDRFLWIEPFAHGAARNEICIAAYGDQLVHRVARKLVTHSVVRLLRVTSQFFHVTEDGNRFSVSRQCVEDV